MLTAVNELTGRSKGGGKMPLKGSKLLGKRFDLDEEGDVSVADQLRDALVNNAVRVIDLFREWDEDGDGTVSKKEFRKAIIHLGLEVPPAAVDELFDSFDKDGGGAINFRELNHLLRRNVKKEVKVVKPVYTVSVIDVQQARRDSALRWTSSMQDPTLKASDPGDELLGQLLPAIPPAAR